MSSTRKNLVYNTCYQILILVLPLITAPYISRVLGAEKIGVYSYTYSIVYYFMLIAMLGINNYGNREIAKARDDKEKLSKTFTSIYALQIIMSVLMTIFYFLYITLFVQENKVIAIIQGIYIISVMFDINWFFFGMEKFKLTVVRNSLIKILSLVLILTFVKQREDIYIYTLILAGSTLLSQLALWPFIKKYTKFVKIKIKDVTKHIKQCIILFIPIIALSVYKIMDKIMLGNMTDMLQVGFYENAEKIINIPMGVITALATVMLPKISNLIANGDEQRAEKYVKKSMEFEFMTSSAVAFGIIAIAQIFVPFFLGNEFYASSSIVQYLSITIIFISVASVIRTQYLIPYGKDTTFVVSLIVGAVLNLFINIILIPKFGAMGAAIGTIIAEFSVFAYQAYAVRKHLKIKEYLVNGFKYILLGIIMCLIVNVFYINVNPMLLIVSKVLLGVIIYAIGVIVIKMIQYKEINLKNVIIKLKRFE